MLDEDIEHVATELEDEFGEIVDESTLRVVIKTRADHYTEAKVRDFVPLLVRRQVRESLKRIA